MTDLNLSMVPTPKNKRFGYELLKNSMRANMTSSVSSTDIDTAVPQNVPPMENGQYTGDDPQAAIKRTYRSDEQN